MNKENTPWTTLLGKMVQELQQDHAEDIQITLVENELIQAIQCVRHVRRCYERPASSTTLSN